MKKCNRCNLLKDILDFYNRHNKCKECIKEENINKNNLIKNYKKDYWLKNKITLSEKIKNLDDVSLQRIKDSKKKHYELNKERYKENYQLNKDNIKEKSKLRRTQYHKYKMETDDIYRLNHGFRRRFNKAIKRGKFNISSKFDMIEILGCEFDYFKNYIESKFEDWMTWVNYGRYNGDFNHGWDIDHIVPISSAKSENDVLKLNHYTNLQPLCSKINRNIKRNN